MIGAGRDPTRFPIRPVFIRGYFEPLRGRASVRSHSVGGKEATGRQWFDQGSGERGVAALAWGYFEREGTAAAMDNSMDFCRSAAARAADRLGIGPPFRQLRSDGP